MARSKFKLISRGVEALLKGSAAEKACRPEAEKVLARARSQAPVKSGAYKASLHIEEETHPTRKVWQVVADADHALVVEANHGTLRRSL